jgi:hypothetical protein
MWHKIIEIKEWFGEVAERYKLLKDFNTAAKMSFISGNAPHKKHHPFTITISHNDNSK